MGEKIVEPFLDKLESLTDQELKEKRYPAVHLLIGRISRKVKPRDAKRLVNLLLREPIVHDIYRGNKNNLLSMLGRVGDEKIIDKLVEYSQKVIATSYQEEKALTPLRTRKLFDQGNVKRTLLDIWGRRTEEERNEEKINEEKIKEIETKTERALDVVDKNIKDIES